MPRGPIHVAETKNNSVAETKKKTFINIKRELVGLFIYRLTVESESNIFHD